MKTREKQNKHKLKFDYIKQLQMLGKIWKKHCSLVNHDFFKTDNTYNNEVIKLMSKSKKKEYCYILDKCDDIAANLTKIDGSLTKSHQAFSNYRKIILED